jgi:hypothetical protein
VLSSAPLIDPESLDQYQETIMKSSLVVFRTTLTNRRTVWFVLLLLVCLMMAGIASLASNGVSASGLSRLGITPQSTAGKLIERIVPRAMQGAMAPGMMMATFIVNDAGDAADLSPGNGACDTGSAAGDQCTLRAAIQEANALAGDDTILFSLTTPVTIHLTGALPDITSNITITGPTISELTVRRDTGGNYRIFTIAAGQTVNISNLTMTNGRTEEGGAIRNSGTLNLTACTLTGNNTVGGNASNPITGGGGAIFNTSTGTLTVIC